MKTCRWHRCIGAVALAALVGGCAPDVAVVKADRPSAAPRIEDIRDDTPVGIPEDEGLDSRRLIALSEWMRDEKVPIFSVLISRNGRLVYEQYTSSLTRDQAHYMMSVTKSVLSALVGVAIDRHLIRGAEASITDSLPQKLFASDADLARFRPITVRDVLGMSVLDAVDPPRVRTPEAMARANKYQTARNRLRFTLQLPLLPSPGKDYQYNDYNPALAGGVVQYATGKGLFEWGDEVLFAPMGFKNHEWMHQDPSGLDMGGYGFRMRPLDMQKFGLLYLNGGIWRGRQLISRSWVEQSFSPWNSTSAAARAPDYGWFWWRSNKWNAHYANGFKGQRIFVFPRQRMLVTITACVEGDSGPITNEVIERFVLPSIKADFPIVGDPAVQARLRKVNEEVRTAPAWFSVAEDRMKPSVERKARSRVTFRK
jgi:CubicO group peptidase (beta-lactamase class C family)